MVPEIFLRSAPCCSATTRYIAKIIGAGELMVIDVVIFGSFNGMPSNSRSMSLQRHDADAALADFAERERMVGIAAHQRRQIERDAEPGAAGGDQILVALVGFLRRPEAGELAHRPQLAAVAARVDAAHVGKLAGIADLALVVDAGHILGGIEPLDRAP